VLVCGVRGDLDGMVVVRHIRVFSLTEVIVLCGW
jgi:hypothetical protein